MNIHDHGSALYEAEHGPSRRTGGEVELGLGDHALVNVHELGVAGHAGSTSGGSGTAKAFSANDTRV
jgi:hypothetical protein